ncbi:hypothetical protein [Paenibacillus sp. OV219]|uniref:hypothetical protein n=1 Tax=Paenibacillus sp. OV219 TaxID=1884377 RepID=UPI0008BC7038|nr:hypothetical protein [Paenibacillus sp. OV219]SEN63766.1 hypothetical protein SAMN05518847_103376 [Paenibacillus sp. OV219]
MRLIQRTGLSLLIASTVIMPVTDILQPVNVFAASSSSTASASGIKSFSLGGGSYAQVTDLQFLYGDSDKTAYFTVSVYNNSNSELDFSDYWVEMWTKSGTKYTIKMNDSDAKNNKVVAKTTTEYHFTAKVNSKLSLSDFSFKLVKWDFSQPDYTRTIGQVSVPTSYNPVIAAGSAKVVKYNSQKMSSVLASSRFAVIGGQLEGVLVYRLTNYSSQNIALGNLNYYIKRSGGLLGKLNVDVSPDEQLAPGATKDIQLYGSLPITKVDPNMQLVVTGAVGEAKTETPVATYSIKPVIASSIFVKPGSAEKLTIDSTPVDSKIRDVFYSRDNVTQSVSMYLNFNNKGKNSVTLPNYSYYLMTSSGSLYPAKQTQVQASSVDLSPGIESDQYLQFSLPLSVKSDGLKLVVRKTSDTNKKGYVVGLLQVPTQSGGQSGLNTVVPAGTGKVVKFNNLKMSSIVPRSRFNLIGGQLDAVVIYRVTNYSTESIPLSNLNYYIKRTGGTLTKLGAEISADEQLAPGESKEILLYGALPITKVDPNMQLVVTGTNPDTKLEAPIASYVVKPLPEASTYVKAGGAGNVTVDSMPVKTQIKNAFYDQNSDTHVLSMYVNFNNSGKSTVTLPNYSYFLMTSDGALYPTKQAPTTNVELSPGIEREQYLQFTLPEKANMTGLKLIMRKTSDTNKKGYVAALFQVPAQSQQSGTERAIQYVTQQGLFEFSVLRAERLAWGNEDMINAVISVRNPQFATKSLPNIKASIQLSGFTVDDKDIQLIKMDQSVAIAGGDYTLYIVSTKVPYTFASSDITISLSEAAGANGDASTPIGQFQIANDKMQLPVVKSTESMSVQGVGRSATVKIGQVGTYLDEENDSKLLYAEFDYSSVESRFSNPANLQAYFKTKDGNFVQAEFLNVKDKVTPNKASLVMAYASFPEDYDLTDVQLVVGQGITQNQFTPTGGTADGMVNAVQYEMPKEQVTAKTDFENLAINPYKISIRKLVSYLADNHQINFDFEYDLSRLVEYEKVAGTHKLVIELVDKDNKFEQTFSLEEGDNALKLGTTLRGSVSFDDEKLIGAMFRNTTLNIYDEFQGHKRLIATQSRTASGY